VDHCLRAKFQLTTPAGRFLQKEQRATRNDLKDQPLPQPGTPVVVMYLNDGNYRAL
jgi:hypothetical protein